LISAAEQAGFFDNYKPETSKKEEAIRKLKLSIFVLVDFRHLELQSDGQ
jgi:hypothetical protein